MAGSFPGKVPPPTARRSRMELDIDLFTRLPDLSSGPGGSEGDPHSSPRSTASRSAQRAGASDSVQALSGEHARHQAQTGVATSDKRGSVLARSTNSVCLVSPDAPHCKVGDQDPLCLVPN